MDHIPKKLDFQVRLLLVVGYIFECRVMPEKMVGKDLFVERSENTFFPGKVLDNGVWT